jgi:GNAT superfamily N-acetyltransferase
MFMGPTDMKKYPKTTQFIQGIEGTLKGQPKIRNAFLEACVADDQVQSVKVAEKLAKEKALRWATGPRVDVHEGLIRPPVQGEIVDACGFTDTFGIAFGRKAFVIVTSYWFDALEYGFDVDPNRAGNRLMRTLLHELVHWVRNEANASDQILVGGYKGHYKEAGHVFEELAYGSTNICTDDEIWAAILSRRN